MEYIVYVFLGLAVSALLILFVVAIKVSQLVNRLNDSLVLLPALIEKLKFSTEKLQDNLDVAKGTLENLNQIISELKIVPSILNEVKDTIKDFENFLQGQIEVIKDDLHFTMEDVREILKDTKSVSTEIKNRTIQVSQGLDPLLKEFTSTLSMGKQFLEHFNLSIKKAYIEINAISTGLSEIVKGFKKIFKI
ncbi:MAG: hypothetical protein ACK4UR_06235 [Caldimicrobium sp.]